MYQICCLTAKRLKMGQSTRCRWGSKEIITNTNRISMVFLRSARAAVYFCLESVKELDLWESLFGNLLVCLAVLPVPSPRRVAPNPATLSFAEAPAGYPNKNSNSRNIESARAGNDDSSLSTSHRSTRTFFFHLSSPCRSLQRREIQQSKM